MIRWTGKLAVVTGASSGIGAAIVKDLARQGVNVVGVARRENKIKEIAEEVKNEKGKVYPLKADLTKEEDIKAAFEWIEKNLKMPVHVLINNAGLQILRDTKDAKMDEWKKMFDLNVLAVGACVREHLKSMKTHNINDGHIINVCSIVGHRVIDFPGFYVYTASKHAVRVITEGIRRELWAENNNTKITAINPGYVNTELFDTVNDATADVMSKFARLESSDVSNAVLYALSLPPNVRVHDLTIQATMEKF